MGSRRHGRPAGSPTPGRLDQSMIDGRGVYVLVLHLTQTQELVVGRLGCFEFPAGFYLYVGSALGPGGLHSRLSRHGRVEKQHHWHIDYLRGQTQLAQIWAYQTDQRYECQWAAAAGALSPASIPAPRFGASDCRCPSHLFHFPQRPEAAAFANAVGLLATKLIKVPCHA